ncbi:MAG TPA: alpha/beta hydrolase, partial [Burkholderiales bacterium]|nr:alpha/beta hydrolase [Burkholderiales bacterium]
DKATDAMLAEVGIPKPENGEPVYASRYAFSKIIAAAMADPKNPRPIVFFVHGFNNTLEDVVARCDAISKTFDVEVVAFSWPANGGGVRGVASYLDDKRDALASVVAFDRALQKARDLLQDLRASAIEAIAVKSNEKFPKNGERFRELLAREAEKHCPIRTTLMLHSMGNYLLERTLKSTALRGHCPLFDNIALCAADVNHEDHAAWLDQLQPRSRLYVTINEDDVALRASRLKGGDEQLARLGHWTSNLNSSQAIYVDFTNAKRVGTSHAYFDGVALENSKVKNFFKAALHGLRAEQEVSLAYDSARNLYRIP